MLVSFEPYYMHFTEFRMRVTEIVTGSMPDFVKYDNFFPFRKEKCTEDKPYANKRGERSQYIYTGYEPFCCYYNYSVMPNKLHM